MKGFKVLEGGLQSTIQDGGRKGYQSMGITNSGAMDTESMRIANAIVGNDYDEAVIEVTIMGPKLEFECSTSIAITGADISPTINNSPVPRYQCLYVKAGDVLEFGARISGCRAYIAIRHGMNIKKVLDSKSTNLVGKFGGYDGRALTKNDFIQINKESKNIRIAKFDYKELYRWEDSKTIRVVSASEEGRFTKEGLNTFYSSHFRVTNDSNRMGIRLEGKKIDHIKSADIISSPVALGTIQVPENGQAIIMMSDRQTTGGYTRIATIVSIDIPRVAQLVPGDEVFFESITVEEAQEIARWRKSRIEFFIGEMNCEDKEVKETSYFNVSIGKNHYNVMVQELEK